MQASGTTKPNPVLAIILVKQNIMHMTKKKNLMGYYQIANFRYVRMMSLGRTFFSSLIPKYFVKLLYQFLMKEIVFKKKVYRSTRRKTVEKPTGLNPLNEVL